VNGILNYGLMFVLVIFSTTFFLFFFVFFAFLPSVSVPPSFFVLFIRPFGFAGLKKLVLGCEYDRSAVRCTLFKDGWIKRLDMFVEGSPFGRRRCKRYIAVGVQASEAFKWSLGDQS
jgi:hypothetical protein